MLNYTLLDITCFTYEEENFIRVTSLHDRRLTIQNITAQLNQCNEKMCQYSLWGEDFVKLAYMAELLSKDYYWGTKTMSLEQWNKVLWMVESKFEIFASNKRAYVLQRVGKRAATPCITPTIKFGGGCYEGGGLFQLKRWGFAPGEGQTKSDKLSRYTAASHNPIWNVACGSRICTHVR